MTSTNSELREAVLAALAAVKDTISGLALTESGRLQGVTVRPEGSVGFVIEAPEGPNAESESLRLTAEEAAKKVEGVTRVTAVLTSHDAISTTSHPPASSGRVRMRQGDRRADSDARPSKQNSAPKPSPLASVNAVVAVTSAKGGVGKSTITANLAIACSQLGLKVGILDADVYGPSIPTMFGTAGRSPEGDGKSKIQPIEAFGIKTMSIGYLADTDAPMVWRGPVATSALMQMFTDVDWGHLDLLLVDTPPGTGDLALTMIQRAPLTGAIIVSTPQEVALADVRRGVAMFRKTHTPLMGLIENMSWYEDPTTGTRAHIFGEGGARKLAEELDVPFLGDTPLITDIRQGGDSGQPAAAHSGSIEVIFRQLAETLISQLEVSENKPPPRIIFD